VWNKQSLTADKAWSSSLGIGRGANNSCVKKPACYEMLTRGIGQDVMNMIMNFGVP
jgi:hypothetical protein